MTGSNESARPAHPPFDYQAVRHAKESLLTDGLLAEPAPRPGIRSVIERSWRRCIGEGLPTNPQSIAYCEVGERESALVRAARPVLERLNDHLADTRAALFLSDGTGNIVMRKAPEPHHRNQLDNVSAAEGFDFSEGSVGTNGIGTVLAERRPLLVRGTEHYNDALEPLTCAGTPIFEPFSRRILGTFALACKVDDTSPLLSAIATDVGRQIESNLTMLLGAEERALIRSYLLANTTDKHPVIVVNERTVFANTSGLRHVSPESHALLWTHLRDRAGQRRPWRTRVPLASGWHDAIIEQVDGTDGRHLAYCVRLLPQPDGAAPAPRHFRPSTRAKAIPPMRSVHPRPDVEEQLATAIRHRELLALDGAPGTGKLHVASALVATYFAGTPLLVLDLSTCQNTHPHTWSTSAMDALAAGRAVVLRHLHDLAPAQLNQVKAIAEGSADGYGRGSAPLIVTIDMDNAPERTGTLVDQIATTVRLPSLAEMPEHLPDLVTRLLAATPGTERETTFSSEALQLLMRWSWPGNIAELRRTVEFLAHRMPGTAIDAGDLPTRMQRTASQRRLTTMETAERDSIIDALRRSGGNRSQAASALGIGRTTLYRKMRTYRLDQHPRSSDSRRGRNSR